MCRPSGVHVGEISYASLVVSRRTTPSTSDTTQMSKLPNRNAAKAMARASGDHAKPVIRAPRRVSCASRPSPMFQSQSSGLPLLSER